MLCLTMTRKGGNDNLGPTLLPGTPSAELQLQPDGRNVHVDVVDTGHPPMAQSRWRKAESPSGRVTGRSSAEAHA